VVRPRFTIYSAIGVDPVRKKLYVHSVPMAKQDQENDGCHIYRIDIASGKMEDLGKVVQKSWGASFWFFIDDKGDCWLSEWGRRGTFPEGGGGNLFRVAADSGKIERFENVDLMPTEMKSPGHGHSAMAKLRLFAWVIRDVALPAHSALSLQEIRHLNSVSLRFTRSCSGEAGPKPRFQARW
jgi:hypothetical protein